MAENSPQMNPNEHKVQHIPHTSPENIGDDSIDRSGASSASALQRSMLENRLQNEMTKMASMVKIPLLLCRILFLHEWNSLRGN